MSIFYSHVPFTFATHDGLQNNNRKHGSVMLLFLLFLNDDSNKIRSSGAKEMVFQSHWNLKHRKDRGKDNLSTVEQWPAIFILSCLFGLVSFLALVPENRSTSTRSILQRCQVSDVE